MRTLDRISDRQAPGEAGHVTRRQFIGTTLATGIVMGVAPEAFCASRGGEVPLRRLGSTGEKVSMIGLGGYHIGSVADQETATQLIRTAIDRGITFMDNCWDYHNGKSEVWMGNALRDGYREKVFLMTKIDGQTKEAAEQQIEESLKRLQTDHLDLLQFHEVIRPGDPERIFAPDGSVHAVLAAKKVGKVRFIGFTGHKDPDIHLHMLETAKKHDVRLDAVQMPLNVMDAHFKSFQNKVLPVLVREKIGVLGMKSLGSGHVLRSKVVNARECLRYALSLPTSVVITGIDKMEYVDQAVDVARDFKPMGKEEKAELLARTAPEAGKGTFEPFKTTTQFDGTIQHPQWLG